MQFQYLSFFYSASEAINQRKISTSMHLAGLAFAVRLWEKLLFAAQSQGILKVQHTKNVVSFERISSHGNQDYLYLCYVLENLIEKTTSRICSLDIYGKINGPRVISELAQRCGWSVIPGVTRITVT